MVLCEQVNGKVVLKKSDVWMSLYTLNQRALNLGACKVLMMKNAVLRVTALAVQVKCTILPLIKVCSPRNKVLSRLWSVADNKLYSLSVALSRATDKRILNMFSKVSGR